MNNLEKEFVPYQIALDMESIGFDEPCLGYYLCRNSAFGIDDLLITTEWIDLLPYDSSSCKTPTYSQIFRWFREKYNLIGLVEGGYDNGKNIFTYVIWDDFKDNSVDIYYETYEQTEIELLKKLIGIVKENKL